jgi:hypothetical protein
MCVKNKPTLTPIIQKSSCFLGGQQQIKLFQLTNYFTLAKISGVARDSVRNEGTREIMGLYKNNHNLQRFSYPPRKSPQYSLYRSLGGPQNRSGRCEDKHLAPARNPNPAVQPVARRDATDTEVIRKECTPHLFFT